MSIDFEPFDEIEQLGFNRDEKVRIREKIESMGYQEGIMGVLVDVISIVRGSFECDIVYLEKLILILRDKIKFWNKTENKECKEFDNMVFEMIKYAYSESIIYYGKNNGLKEKRS
jgi:hypothetical protein